MERIEVARRGKALSTVSDVAAKKEEGRRLSALRVVDRDKWVREIKRAMKAAGGRIPDAAEALGIHERSLYRYLDEPDFADVTRVAVGSRRSQ
jgi:ActR/RegA family two-component response regulator